MPRMSDGSVVITRERIWVDGVAEALTPLRSTGVYVLDGDRILSITQVLDADQRYALMREALVGTWREFGGVAREDRYRWRRGVRGATRPVIGR